MNYDKEQVLRNLVVQTIYANFNERERKHIDIGFYQDCLIDDVEDTLKLMVEEISYLLSQIQEDPYEDSLELKETDIWHTGE